MLELVKHKLEYDKEQHGYFCFNVRAGTVATLIRDTDMGLYYMYGYIYADAAEKALYNLQHGSDGPVAHANEYLVSDINKVLISSIPLEEFD